jgi:hypothetical protein
MKYTSKTIHTLLLFVVLLWSITIFASSGKLEEGEIVVDGRSYFDVALAQAAIKDNSSVFFGPGIYKTGLKVIQNNVRLSGDNTHFKGAVIEGKATFVISGNNTTIESIECSDVAVRDSNGACVRFEGDNLTLSNVYFHNSQQGLLQGGKKGGTIIVKYSLFENLGKSGRAHGIYTSGDILDIKYTKFIGTRDQGHAIKSRSKITRLDNVIIDSAKGNDSRSIDIPNGGELYVNNSVIYQGINTVNGQIVGYALESLGRQREYAVEFVNSIVIGERPNGNTFLLARENIPDLKIAIYDNVFIGRFTDEDSLSDKSNIRFKDRKEAGLKRSELPESEDVLALRLRAIE